MISLFELTRHLSECYTCYYADDEMTQLYVFDRDAKSLRTIDVTVKLCMLSFPCILLHKGEYTAVQRGANETLINFDPTLSGKHLECIEEFTNVKPQMSKVKYLDTTKWAAHCVLYFMQCLDTMGDCAQISNTLKPLVGGMTVDNEYLLQAWSATKRVWPFRGDDAFEKSVSVMADQCTALCQFYGHAAVGDNVQVCATSETEYYLQQI